MPQLFCEVKKLSRCYRFSSSSAMFSLLKMFEVENIHQPCLWCHLSIQGVGLEDEGDPSLYYYHKISLYYYHKISLYYYHKISSTSSQNMMHREQSNSTH